MRNTYKIFVDKFYGQKQFRRPMDLGVDWIQVAHNRVLRRTCVTTVIDLRATQKAGNSVPWCYGF